LALINFMRLSSMKAAHAVVAWCRVLEIRGCGFLGRKPRKGLPFPGFPAAQH
jgi:hypothetical protein